jgi:hypothetical protein
MKVQLVDADELAELLDVSRDTVLCWRRRGVIPALPARAPDGSIIFNLGRVLQALRDRRGHEEDSGRLAIFA